jgi:hypothetical protein
MFSDTNKRRISYPHKVMILSGDTGQAICYRHFKFKAEAETWAEDITAEQNGLRYELSCIN